MAKEKRTKPCSNCKKSKVKCIYTDSLPCERCKKSGVSYSCQFVPKLPSLKLPLVYPPSYQVSTPNGRPVIGRGDSISGEVISGDPRPANSLSSGNPIMGPSERTLPHTLAQGHPQDPHIHQHVSQAHQQVLQQPLHQKMAQALPPFNTLSNTPHNYVVSSNSNIEISSDSQWKNLIESRINSFDNKLNDLVDILKTNQQYMLENQQRHSPFPIQQEPQPQLMHGSGLGYFKGSNSLSPPLFAQSFSYPPSRNYSPVQPKFPSPSIPNRMQKGLEIRHTELDTPRIRPSETDLNVPSKRHKSSDFPLDFRNGFLTKDEAHELFSFFDANISQQLFGFEISKFSVNSNWKTCPVLVCAICAIASIHHPILSKKSCQLQVYLHDLCGSLLLKGKPTNESEGFNTIVALVLCSFWLSNSQMFTGLALQLAKEYGLNNPYSEDKEKLKLWYLLYVLDGQQSLTFNRQPLVNSQEYSLKHSKEILLSEKMHLTSSHKQELIQPASNNNANSLTEPKEKSQLFADMRLVSQVEYNQALNEAFKGNAWEILAPSSFGIPSKSNLELDRWMVSWTVLLAPGNNGAVWSSKSTLIYYNFAKMHINSSAVRLLQVNPTDNGSMLPKWDSSLQTENGPQRPHATIQKVDDDEEDSSDDDSDDQSGDDQFISNKALMTDDETIVNANIAVNAAQTVLNLVINDKDIVDNLKYVPVHIHIMLYYAALLVLNPPSRSTNKEIKPNTLDYCFKLLGNLKVIKSLQKKFYDNLPIDTKFGNRLIKSLEEAFEEKLNNVDSIIHGLPEDDTRAELQKQVTALMEISKGADIVEVTDDSGGSRGSTPGPEKISAWPGSNHGHP